MRIRPALGAAALLTTILGPAEASALECKDLPIVLAHLQGQHLAGGRLSGQLRQRTVDRFLKLLDPSRTLLTEAEVEKLKHKIELMFPALREGKCESFGEVSQVIVGAIREDEKLVRKLLGPEYKLDETVELITDHEKRGFAKSPKERATLLTKMVHFQIANSLMAKVDLEKSKERVIKRYELSSKRAEERLDPSGLTELFAEAFAGALDPHTDYMSPETLEDFKIHMQLSLEGIGAALRSEDGMTIIESLVAGGQAEKSGAIQPKDKILAVGQEGEEPISVIDMDLRDVVKMIRGKKGTKVHLTILRDGPPPRTFDVSIVRDKIDIKEQAAKITYEERTLNGKKLKLGVIDLPSFYGGEKGGRSAHQDVRALLKEAVEKGVDGILLDLSRNGGGLLQDAVDIAGLFLAEGGVVATVGADQERQVLEDEDEEIVYSGPLVVEISPSSASGSEILAGALKDYRRALLVGGEHTFGKGTVQSLVPLPVRLGAIKVTTAMFFIPSGVSTQLKGVTPHLHVPSLFDLDEFGEESLDYSLPVEAITPFRSSEVNIDDPCKGWVPVTTPMVTDLAARSKKRVSESPAFKELAAEIAKRKIEKDKVRLSDLREQAREEDSEAQKKKFERLQEATTKEALDALVDLVQLSVKQSACGEKSR